MTPRQALDLGVVVLRRMWRGDNTMTAYQFQMDLMSGRLQVVALPLGALFLVTWGESNRKKLCRILTVVATAATNPERSDLVIEAFERLAAERGAQVVMSFGRRGYKETVERRNWTTDVGLLMRKEL